MRKKRPVIKVAARQCVIRKRYKNFLDDLEKYLVRAKKELRKDWKKQGKRKRRIFPLPDDPLYAGELSPAAG